MSLATNIAEKPGHLPNILPLLLPNDWIYYAQLVWRERQLDIAQCNLSGLTFKELTMNCKVIPPFREYYFKFRLRCDNPMRWESPPANAAAYSSPRSEALINYIWGQHWSYFCVSCVGASHSRFTLERNYFDFWNEINPLWGKQVLSLLSLCSQFFFLFFFYHLIWKIVNSNKNWCAWIFCLANLHNI